MVSLTPFKKIVKKTLGRDNYSKILNTSVGTWMHNKLHEGSESSRDFVLQKMPKRSVCAEIGVHRGDFSERILEIVQPKELHLIDPWRLEQSEVYDKSYYGKKTVENQNVMDERFNDVLNRFEREIRNKQVIVDRGYSETILQNFQNEYFDWIYVDGNHLYEFVKKDLEICYLKVKISGYITGDDYNEGGWWEGGVKKAVDEFALNNKKIKLIEIKANQFILQKLG